MSATTHPSERLTYSVETAAAVLGISRALAYQLVRTGEIPSLRLGRRVVVPCHALAELLDVHPAPARDTALLPQQLHLFALPEAIEPGSA